MGGKWVRICWCLVGGVGVVEGVVVVVYSSSNST